MGVYKYYCITYIYLKVECFRKTQNNQYFDSVVIISFINFFSHHQMFFHSGFAAAGRASFLLGVFPTLLDDSFKRELLVGLI